MFTVFLSKEKIRVDHCDRRRKDMNENGNIYKTKDINFGGKSSPELHIIPMKM